jgi:carboxymethylenebutenolidase
MPIQEMELKVQGDKRELDAFLARPEDSSKSYPGILVIHEIFGLTDHIRDITRRFAKEGYAALAVDLFSGRNKALCMARFIMAVLSGSTGHEGIRDLEAALRHLSGLPRVNPKRIGAIGFCMGGGFAIVLACRDKKEKRILKAIAPFYAMNPKPLEQVAGICPLVGSYPEKDFTAKKAQALDLKLTEYGVEHDIKIYPGAKHGFMAEERKATFAPEAAQDAWKRTIDFFSKHI